MPRGAAHPINLGSHSGKIVRELVRSAGGKLLFVPKYSSELDPIEQVFVKLKHFLQKAAARTVEAGCLANSRPASSVFYARTQSQS